MLLACFVCVFRLLVLVFLVGTWIAFVFLWFVFEVGFGVLWLLCLLGWLDFAV